MKYTITTLQLPEASELLKLFLQTSWAKNRSKQGIAFLLKNTTTYVAVRDNDQLIGFGRAISDGIYRAMLDDIVVDTKYRKQGVGQIIVEQLVNQLNDVEQVFLNTKLDLEPFYEKYGFSRSKGVTMSL